MKCSCRSTNVCPWLIYFKSSLSSLPLKGSCRFRTSSTLDSIAAIGMLSGSGLSATSAVTTLVRSSIIDY